MSEKLSMGDRVRHTVSGFAGIVVGRTEWQNGCVRYGVDAEQLHEGKPIETQWFDEQSLALVDAGVVPPPTSKLGGPRADPKQPSGH